MNDPNSHQDRHNKIFQNQVYPRRLEGDKRAKIKAE